MINKILTCLSHQLSHLGVCTVQINYLIDEAVNVEKESPLFITFLPLMAWVRMWHIYTRTTALARIRISIKIMMSYLIWSVLTGHHQQIILSFLPVGHTKFFPDAGFGMLKRKFRVTNVGCLNNIASVVQKSAAMSHAELVGDQQGNVIVPSYDWVEFFQGKTIKNALKDIKKMAQFQFTSQSPGYVYINNTNDARSEH